MVPEAESPDATILPVGGAFADIPYAAAGNHMGSAGTRGPGAPWRRMVVTHAERGLRAGAGSRGEGEGRRGVAQFVDFGDFCQLFL